MNRIEYFTNKLWNVATEIHTVTYISIMISITILFFITKYLIQKIKPNIKWVNYKAALIAFIIGPIAFFGILHIIVMILLRNQSF